MHQLTETITPTGDKTFATQTSGSDQNPEKTNNLGQKQHRFSIRNQFSSELLSSTTTTMVWNLCKPTINRDSVKRLTRDQENQRQSS